MSDGSEIIGLVGGSAGLVTLAVGLVKMLGGRIVQREDEDKKALQAKVDEQSKTERSIERTLIGLERDVSALRSDLAKYGLAADQRAASQDKEISDIRTEFKEELRQLEHRLKSDVQRIVSASQPSRGKGRT